MSLPRSGERFLTSRRPVSQGASREDARHADSRRIGMPGTSSERAFPGAQARTRAPQSANPSGLPRGAAVPAAHAGGTPAPQGRLSLLCRKPQSAWRCRVHRRCLASRHDVVLNVMAACLASSRGSAPRGTGTDACGETGRAAVEDRGRRAASQAVRLTAWMVKPSPSGLGRMRAPAASVGIHGTFSGMTDSRSSSSKPVRRFDTTPSFSSGSTEQVE